MDSKICCLVFITVAIVSQQGVLTQDPDCKDASALCPVRLSGQADFCTNNQTTDNTLCDKTCGRCTTTTTEPTTITSTVPSTMTKASTTTEKTTTAEKTTSTSTSTTTTTTEAPTTVTTTTTTSPTSTVKPSTARPVTRDRNTRQPTNKHTAVKLQRDDTDSNYNVKVEVVFLGHYNSKPELGIIGRAVRSALESYSTVNILKFAEVISELGQAGNNSGIRLTTVSWNAMVDSPNVPDLILMLNNMGTLGDDIDLELYTDLPKAQVYNGDDFQPAAAGPGSSKQESTTKKTGIDGSDWGVIGGAIGVGVGLLILMGCTVYRQKRSGTKRSLELGKADYGVEYSTAKTEL